MDFLSASLQDAEWLAALSQEASKSYLLELRNFVKRERASKTIFPPANESECFEILTHAPCCSRLLKCTMRSSES